MSVVQRRGWGLTKPKNSAQSGRMLEGKGSLGDVMSLPQECLLQSFLLVPEAPLSLLLQIRRQM